jgi:8-oxo-dGTP diphosphatase
MNKNIHVLSRAVILSSDHILLCRTMGMKCDFYFLPGGHIEHGEDAESALLRELIEEAGASDCKIKRFLGCLEYSFEFGTNSMCHNHEYNFIFEVISDSLKISNIIPKLEENLELQWIQFSKINEIDFRAEPLKLLIPQWLDSAENNIFHSRKN